MNIYKKYMIKGNLIMLFIVICFFLYPIEVKGKDKNKERKNILIVNPFGQTQYHKSVLDGIKNALDEYEEEINTVTAVIDENNTALKYNHLKQIIETEEIDLILCLDKYSAEYLSKNRKDMFGERPILYTDISNNPIEKDERLGGIYADYDIDSFLPLILKLHPNTTEVNFIINKETQKSQMYKEIEQYIKEENKLNVKYNIISENRIVEVLPKIDKKNTVSIIYNPLKQKVEGEEYYRELSVFGTIQNLANKTTVPIYGGIKEFGTRFNVGAYNFGGLEVGQGLIKYAVAILDGKEKVEDIGVYKVNNYEKVIVNSEIAPNYNIKKNLSNIKYYNYGKSLTIFTTRKMTMTYYTISLLVLFLIISAAIGIHTRKLYKERLRVNKVNSNFIANVSHELRTPLNIILSTIQLLYIYEKKGDLIIKSSKVSERVWYLKKNSLRLLKLVNNIIDFSKIDAGYYNVKNAKYNIVELVEDITLSSVGHAEKNGISLVFDTTEEEIISVIDKDNLERIVLNLISNALKFSKKGGEVLVLVSKNNNYINIKVKDNGSGIPAEYKEKIFNRFIQVEDNALRKNEGSGIGLSLCKYLVNLHDGNIKVNSEVGKGSEFIIELPIKENENLTLESLKQDDLHEKINLEYSDLDE